MLTYLLSLLAANALFLILYISNTGSFPKPLSAAQEREYLLRCKQGDAEARSTLIERNLRLVAHIIKKYYSSSKEQEDLISIGSIGLIKAIDSFDCDKGARLATYAARCIENEILMYFRNIKRSASDVSLNDPIDTDKDGNTLSLIDILSSEDTILENVELKSRIRQLYKFIEGELYGRERTIIELRFGLRNHHHKTQREVAELLGISRSYVSRIEKKALDKLANAFTAQDRGIM